MMFRAKLLALTMTGILLVGIIPLAATAFRRAQLREDVMQELNALGRSECAKVAKAIYLMLRAQHEKLKKEVRYDLNVAEYVTTSAGGVSLSKRRVPWTAVNQLSGQTIRIDLPELRLGDRWIGQNTDHAVPSPVVDEVRKLVGARCTIFQRMNDSGDLLRVCTNVPKKDGTRAIGTYIPANEPDGGRNPVVASVLRGKTYVGRAYVVDDWYLTTYDWLNPGEQTPRRKVVAATYFQPWDWVVGASAYEDDFQAAIARVDESASRLVRWGTIGALMAFALCGVLAWVESGRIALMKREIADRKAAQARQEGMLQRLVGLNRLQKDLLLPGSLGDNLRKIADAAVQLFELDLCRIWHVGPGDLCSAGCIHAETAKEQHRCLHRDACLHLMASSGRYAHSDGEHHRVPLGSYKIGRIASGEEDDFLTNDVATDPRIHNHAWAKELGLVAFAGYKLRDTSGNPIGVLAAFAKHALSEEDNAFLSNLAEITSGVILESKAEESLRNSEVRYKALYDSSADAIMLRTLDRRIVGGNKAAVALFGCKDESELISRAPRDLYPERQPDGSLSSEKAAREIEVVVREGSHFLEWRYRRRDGTEFDAMVSMTSMAIERECLILMNVRDTTVQKRAQEALQESERRLASIIDFLPDATFAIDSEGKVIAWNHAMEEMTGIPAKQMLGQGDYAYALPFYGEPRPVLVDLVFRDDREIEGRYRSVVRKGTQLIAETSTSRLSNKRKTHLWIVAAPLYDSAGRLVGAIESVRDITDRKDAESALQTSERRYRLLAENVRDVIWTLDFSGDYTYMSPSAEQLLGIRWEEGMKVTAAETLAPGSRKTAEKLLADVAAAASRGQSLRVTTELELLRRDGSTVWVEATGGEMSDELGRIVGILGVSRDITDRKQAEEAVRASEAKYRALYDASSDAILLRTPDRRVVGANRAAVVLFGCKDESELLAMTPADLYAEYQPDGRLSSEKAPLMAEIALRDGSYFFEWRYRRKDGTEFLANVLWTRMELDGKPILLTTIRDITDQRRAEEALRATERQLRLLADNVSDVIWAMDFSGRFIYMSPSVQQLLGYTAEEAVRFSMDDTLTPDAAALARNLLQETVAAVQAGERFRSGTLELEQVRKDGSTVMTEVSYSGMYDESGKLVAVQGVGRDITDRKRAEQALRATERRLRLLADNLSDVIWAIDFSGHFTYISPSVQSFFGHSVEEAMQLTIDDLLTPESSIMTHERLEQAMAMAGAGQRVTGQLVELEMFRKDGSRVTTDVSYGGMYDESGQIVGIQGITHDVTERKRIELDLAQARDEAQAANRAKSQFLATMSHEIRTPMTAILGYADLLMDPTLSASSRNDYAATIRRSGEHLLALINDILDLSRIEAGRMTLDFGVCHIAALLADVTAMLRPRAEQRGIAFTLVYPGPLPETIRIDGARLRQAIINLVGNAIKFTEQGSVRIVASFLPDGCSGQPAVQIDVIDTGIGIGNSTLAQLFRPFSQGDPSVTRKYGGSGLGLAISHHLAELLGGKLTVQSELGQGSTFTLTVPTGSLDGVEMLQHPADVVGAGTGKDWTPDADSLLGVRILLAEDGLDNRELIQAILQRSGALVDAAENGRIAIGKTCERSFDLILMDMNMPEMDGYEATALLRNRGYQGPIVALTANAMIGDSERCREAGCNAYLTKPIDRGLLVKTIAALVDTKLAAARAIAAGEAAPPQASAPIPAGATPPPEAATGGEELLVSELANDPDMAPIIKRFIGRLAEQLEAMRQTQASHAHADLCRLAHKLKGAGGSYGYPRLTDACKVLEDAARAQDEAAEATAVEKVAALVHAIQKAHSRDLY